MISSCNRSSQENVPTSNRSRNNYAYTFYVEYTDKNKLGVEEIEEKLVTLLRTLNDKFSANGLVEEGPLVFY